MLKDISETHKNGGDVSACIAKYRKIYNYVYIYNDNIFKLLFGNPENESITVDFLNAVLKLDGGDCIEKVTDDSYDFLNLMPFVEKLREGYELVMGNRFKGGIEKGRCLRYTSILAIRFCLL